MDKISKNKPSISMYHEACESKLRSVNMRSGTCGSIHAQETGWQSGVQSCMPRLPAQLNACTVTVSINRLTLMLLVAYLANTKLCKKNEKMTETLALGYSSESTQQKLSYEYPHGLVRMILI